MDELRIDVMTPLGFRVVCSSQDWHRIAGIKHPPMRGRIRDVERTLEEPDQIRRSSKDPQVKLFHRRHCARWVCAVVDRGTFVARLITAYPADKVKQGDAVEKVRVFYDSVGRTLSVWIADPESEDACEEVGDDTILMKNAEGQIIGFERLNVLLKPGSPGLTVEVVSAPGHAA